MREFLERIIDERDRLYKERARATETIIEARFLAQEKSVAAAFLAAEKATDKTEEAQKAYNVVHNDLSRKMDAQYKEMMPHDEAVGLFSALEEKIEDRRLLLDSKLESQRLAFEKDVDALKNEVTGLRESRSKTSGTSQGLANGWSILIGAVGILGVIASIIILIVRP